MNRKKSYRRVTTKHSVKLERLISYGDTMFNFGLGKDIELFYDRDLALHSVVTGLISCGGDHGIHC